MKRFLPDLILGLICFFASFDGFSQTLYNPKNVDRTAASFFDGQQTFRALEYSTDPQGNNKVYRLQTLSENGLPATTLQGTNQGNTVYFEDKDPFDNQFTDNLTPYLSAEAVQLHYGFQAVLKATEQRFGWKGLDGIGVSPVKVLMQNMDEIPDGNGKVYYFNDGADEYFFFGRSLNDSTDPFASSLEIIGHEFCHAVFQHRANMPLNIEFCREEESINEGVSFIFGLYIKNKIKQTTPQNYIWTLGDQLDDNPMHVSDPKSHQVADTYNGEFYVNVCSEDYDLAAASGVVLKWYYLLSEGFPGSAYNDLGYGYSNLQGIGVEKAIQIVWDAIPGFTINTDYPAFRKLTLQVAEKLYGLHSTEYLAVQNAWCAVGVCDNNPIGFSMSPVNGAGNIIPWPAVNVNLIWQNDLVQEWEVQMSTKYDFSENLQTVTVDNFTTVVDQNGLLVNYAAFDGYYHPGEKVYARAKITKADPNFCKGPNPLCTFYQQFGPTHAFTLKDQKIEFWPDNSLSKVVNPWDKPAFRWKSIPGTDRYRIHVATDDAFNNLVYDDIVLHTGNFTESGKINTVLEMGQNYYMRVRAERLDFIKINKNYGKWSDVVKLYTATPQTSITQALNQKANDPAKLVSSLGFWVTWYPYPGATNYVIQVAKDAAFIDIARSQTVSANINTLEFLLPLLPDQTELFVRVLPQKGAAFGICNNVWRVKTDEHATVPVMKSPASGTDFPFRNFLSVFQWNGGTLNMNTVDHFEVWVTEKTFGLTSIFTTQGKVFDFALQDPFMFDDKMGITMKVLAVGPHGAKSALSAPFDYDICPDHPEVIFPVDQISKVDALLPFNIQWQDSFWFDAGSAYLVTIRDAVTGVPVSGFSNKPTTTTAMLVPAGTLTSGKSYSITVKNSSSCIGINVADNIVTVVGSGGFNQPQSPKLVNFNIELKGFRNDLDGLAWETSDYVLGIELIDPDGNLIPLADANDPNGNQVTQLLVDSEDSGVVLVGNNKPEGKYKLRLKMKNIFNPLLYYPFDQPRFSVFLNGNPIVNPHIITTDFVNPASPFNEWQNGFQFADIVLDVK
jgi:hypothetical protein